MDLKQKRSIKKVLRNVPIKKNKKKGFLTILLISCKVCVRRHLLNILKKKSAHHRLFILVKMFIWSFMLRPAKMYQYLHKELRNSWVIKNMSKTLILFDLLGPNGFAKLYKLGLYVYYIFFMVSLPFLSIRNCGGKR